ncbi:MAG: glutathione S-transferase C-terminal domain-containing protein [Myxococcota bacterium]
MFSAHHLDAGVPSDAPVPFGVRDGRLLRPTPAFAAPAALPEDAVLVVALGDAWGQALAAVASSRPDGPAIATLVPGTHVVADGPLAGASLPSLYQRTTPSFTGAALAPLLATGEGLVLTDDPVALAGLLAPDEDDARWRRFLGERLVDGALALRREDDQGRYQVAWHAFRDALLALEARLEKVRYLAGGDAPTFADLLLFAFLVRLDAVHYELSKANPFRLAELPALHAFARDLYERPELHETTDGDAIRRHHYLQEPGLNPRGLLPRGGLPELDAPHDRDVAFAAPAAIDAGVEEDPTKRRGGGEWVRPQSAHRSLIAPGGPHPPEPGRYHLYAPYNCPWSHRALLGRAVKGLEDVVGASVVYFRRDPEHGWQFNARIPGCTADLAEGERYLQALYRRVGSTERSAPVLWDREAQAIVSNESAEILRMFDGAFGDLATRELVLVPEAHRGAIDRMNALVYQRINNGAYKAGFAKSQQAYDRAFDRYFAMLDYLEALLGRQPWLVPTDAPTEADLRLFPTVFRHDPVYFTRFRLNRRRIADYPRLSDWLARMLAVPGVAEASNLDHARNGYFGRTGNGVVPYGPVPLGLSPADYDDVVWQNRP